MDFIKVLKDKLESLAFTPSTIYIGVYDSDKNSVAIVPTPSSIDDRYISRDIIYPFSFQVMAYNKDNFLAYNTLNQLLQVMDGVDGRDNFITSNDDSFELVSIECTTTPNHVEQTDFGDLWTTVYTAELYIKKG